MLLSLTQGANIEAKTKGCRQQGPVCAGNQTGARFVLNLKKCVYSSGQNWVQEVRGTIIIIIKKPIVFNKQQRQINKNRSTQT